MAAMVTMLVMLAMLAMMAMPAIARWNGNNNNLAATGQHHDGRLEGVPEPTAVTVIMTEGWKDCP